MIVFNCNCAYARIYIPKKTQKVNLILSHNNFFFNLTVNN